MFGSFIQWFISSLVLFGGDGRFVVRSRSLPAEAYLLTGSAESSSFFRKRRCLI